MRDEYKAYETVLDANKYPGRMAAACLAHARRKFDELLKANASTLAVEAVRRIAGIYRVERQLACLQAEERLAWRQLSTQPLWEELHLWLQLERTRVPDGSATAQAIDYRLNHWAALTRNLHDGAVPVDNNHLENQMRPWSMGRKAWLFAGSTCASTFPNVYSGVMHLTSSRSTRKSQQKNLCPCCQALQRPARAVSPSS